jgi:GT2 family glycosyltransferase
VVVNYASSALIEANLGGLRLEHARVVVVDNYSGAAERSRIAALAAEHGWTLVAPDDNRGFGAGVNAGARAAEQLGCGCYLLLNPDCQVTADTVEELRRASLADETALVAPQLVDLQGRVESGGSTLDLVSGRIRSLRRTLAEPDPTARPVTWLTAACLVVHREMWHRLSGFDETFFMYWEDVDFGYRALAQGGRPVLRTDLAGVHDQGGTQGPRRGRAKSDLYYFYNCRNRMLFASRHLDRRGLLRWLVRTPRITWEVLLQGGRRQLLESPRPAWAALRGGASGCWLGVRGLLPRRVRDLVS